MSFTFSGDFAGLDAIKEKIAGLKGVPKRVAIELVPEIESLVTKEFAYAEDPYGNPWAPLVGGGAGPLSSLSDEVTTTLVGGTKIRVSTSGFLNFHHHGTQQISKKTEGKRLRADIKSRALEAKLAGTSKGKAGRAIREQLKADRASVKERAAATSAASGIHDPARPVIPNDSEGAPEAWVEAFDKIADKVLEALDAL